MSVQRSVGTCAQVDALVCTNIMGKAKWMDVPVSIIVVSLTFPPSDSSSELTAHPCLQIEQQLLDSWRTVRDAMQQAQLPTAPPPPESMQPMQPTQPAQPMQPLQSPSKPAELHKGTDALLAHITAAHTALLAAGSAAGAEGGAGDKEGGQEAGGKGDTVTGKAGAGKGRAARASGRVQRVTRNSATVTGVAAPTAACTEARAPSESAPSKPVAEEAMEAGVPTEQ